MKGRGVDEVWCVRLDRDLCGSNKSGVSETCTTRETDLTKRDCKSGPTKKSKKSRTKFTMEEFFPEKTWV